MPNPRDSKPRAQPRREHLIEIALDLFNRHGFHQTGIDTLMRESGVSKTTLYKYFPSKEDLVLEALKLRSARTLRGIEERVAGLLAAKPDATAAERVDAILGVIQEWVEGGAFFGCNFVRAAGEYAGDHQPILEQARAHKQAIRALIEKQLRDHPAEARDRLSGEILLIVEGAIAVAQVGAAMSPMASARRLIASML
ncbi:TetR/AcrR family transcriptional regulator [Azospirillum sp. sgz302134]